MNLKLGFVVLVAFIAGCSSSTIVEPPPPCSSTLPSETLTVACTPPVIPNPVGSWSGTLTTEGGSGSQTFTAGIEGASSGDYTGVFTVAEKSSNVNGFRYTGADGELFSFQSPNGALAPQLTPALYTGLTWSGTVTDAAFSGTWTQSEDNEVLARGTFTLERQP